jgi:two-component system, sporulation sensor kinase C
MDHQQKRLFHGDASIGLLLVSWPDLKICDCNAEAERIYGASPPDELVGRSVLELSAYPDETKAMLDQAVINPRSASSRRVHRKLDGTSFPVHVAFSIQRDPEAIWVTKFVLDAGPMERTERLLQESYERFRMVADYTYDWESWIDIHGKLVWVNPAVEKLTGYGVAECMEMDDYPIPIVDPSDQAKIRALLHGAIQGTSGNDFEFMIQKKNGQKRWFAVSWQTLLDASGLPVGTRMSKRDISDRKAVENELKRYTNYVEELAALRAQKIVDLEKRRMSLEKLASLGTMAASVAHEINNPIAGMKNAIRLIAESDAVSRENASLLKSVDREIDRIAMLLRQMNQLCRPTVTPATQVAAISTIKEVVSNVEAQCAPKRLQVHIQSSQEEVHVCLCEPEFRQIVHNLLLNAYEASLADSPLEIQVYRTDSGNLVVIIRDHGQGISSEFVEQIYEPFFTTKQESGRSGTGLGLAITRSLTLALGGAIDYEATPGGGATFRLDIPSQE